MLFRSITNVDFALPFIDSIEYFEENKENNYLYFGCRNNFDFTGKIEVVELYNHYANHFFATFINLVDREKIACNTKIIKVTENNPMAKPAMTSLNHAALR